MSSFLSISSSEENMPFNYFPVINVWDIFVDTETNQKNRPESYQLFYIHHTQVLFPLSLFLITPAVQWERLFINMESS